VIRLTDLIFEKKLRVFDFDDTLVKSNSKVFLIRNGEKKEMTPGEFAIYKKKPGDEFDSDKHEAISQIPVNTKNKKGKIIDIVEKGYQLGEKIIRYPKVVVGK